VELPDTLAGQAQHIPAVDADTPVVASNEVESKKVNFAAPERTLGLRPEKIDALMLGVFRRAGLGEGQASPNLIGELTRVAGYNVWGSLIQSTTGFWYDFVLEVSRAVAINFYTTMRMSPPTEEAKLLGALCELQTKIIVAMQGELRQTGVETLFPFQSVASPSRVFRAPERLHRQNYFVEKLLFGLTVGCQPCACREESAAQLRPKDVLAEGYPCLKETAVLLNRGTVLTTHFIEKISLFEHSRPDRPRAKVFRPSQTALDFFANQSD
jgi:hypothetical protein